MLDPVGPEGQPAKNSGARDTLVVFSGLKVHQNSDPANDHRQHSDYEIWQANGSQRLQLVSNHHLPFTDDEPAPVPLAPGRDLVKAMANSFPSVAVPAVIEAGRETAVHLEGGGEVDKSRSSPDKVYLADGEVVGAKAPAVPGARTGGGA